MILSDIFHIVDKNVLGDHDIFVGSDCMIREKIVVDYANMRIYNKNFSVDLIEMSSSVGGVKRVRAKKGIKFMTPEV